MKNLSYKISPNGICMGTHRNEFSDTLHQAKRISDQVSKNIEVTLWIPIYNNIVTARNEKS